jgi:beta-mannosidase
MEWPLEQIKNAGAMDTSRVIAVADVSAEDKIVSRNLAYLVPVKEIHLKPAQLSVETTGENGNYRIRITSPVLARSVYLSFGALDATVSDNYFNLLPGEAVEVTATSKASLNELKANLKVISLADAFTAESQTAGTAPAK